MEARRDVFGLEDEAIDSDYLHFLYQGSEHLSAGDLNGAREALEKSYRLKPRHQKTASLLALTYFKLGVYDRALDLYHQLCDDHPTDPTLRVNMALVHLKTGRVDLAITELDRAVDLAPEHSKALNYLGLAWAQKGDLIQARDYFLRAKNDAMAAKMERQVTEQAGGPPPAAPAEAAAESAPAGEDAPPAHKETPAEAALAVAEPTAHTAPMRVILPPQPAAVETPSGQPVALASFTSAVQLNPPTGVPYSLAGAVLAIDVGGVLLTRLEGLLATIGELTFTPEMKRFRGKATDKAFGERQRRMVRVQGHGRLILARGERLFTALDLDEEAGYFREDALFSFEEKISFENGRVPSKVSPDLHLVHLRGEGAFLLSTLGPVASIEVVKGFAARVPLDGLIGWHGALAPKIVVVAEEAGAEGPLVAVELSGEGRVLVELPPPDPRVAGQ